MLSAIGVLGDWRARWLAVNLLFRIYEITDSRQGNNGLFYENKNKSIEKYKKEIADYVTHIVERLCKETQKLDFDIFEAADNLNRKYDSAWDAHHSLMGDNGYVGTIEYNVVCEVNNLY